jgi:hypothetical protein
MVRDPNALLPIGSSIHGRRAKTEQHAVRTYLGADLAITTARPVPDRSSPLGFYRTPLSRNTEATDQYFLWMDHDILTGKTMPTTQPPKQPTDLEQHMGETLNDLIGQHLMHALGNPGSLLKVQVKHLWSDHYRVNVLVGADAASAKVAHSYFLEADDNGNITASTPAITRKY